MKKKTKTNFFSVHMYSQGFIFRLKLTVKKWQVFGGINMEIQFKILYAIEGKGEIIHQFLSPGVNNF